MQRKIEEQTYRDEVVERHKDHQNLMSHKARYH